VEKKQKKAKHNPINMSESPSTTREILKRTRYNFRTVLNRSIAIIGLLALMALACMSSGINPVNTPTSDPIPLPETDLIYKAEIAFWAQVPEDTPTGDMVYLVILDEVTGLPYNQEQLEMIRVDATHYWISVQAEIGSVIKYYYQHSGSTAAVAQEFTTRGEPVRYRIYYVDGPGEIVDIISRWGDTLSIKPTGRIIGSVFESGTGIPLPNILILAGGHQVLSASDGSFIITGLPSGKHQIVGYALDGSHTPYKHFAIVGENSATPVNLEMAKMPHTDVTFIITAPEDTTPGIPIRFACNLFQFGNTFADLGGGISGHAVQMPILTPIGDGRYSLTLKLPAGIDIRYKYTLGDGFWNAEREQDGSYIVRQLVIPYDGTPLLVEDKIETWYSTTQSPIWFDVTVPENTPPEDHVSIQFYLYDWMAPLPMWPAGENRWAFQLISPTNIGGDLLYRYCRNGQCGGNSAVATENLITPRYINSNLSVTQIATDQIESWQMLTSPTECPYSTSSPA
jgi:hypothetical protein